MRLKCSWKEGIKCDSPKRRQGHTEEGGLAQRSLGSPRAGLLGLCCVKQGQAHLRVSASNWEFGVTGRI